nr:hypothetical protein [Tanacetum cinerariifolium]
MPSHIKTYDGSEDPEDHLKIFQAATKTERWAMPTWCHMFNSTLTCNARLWFDDLPPESIDSYDDLKKAFLENYLQQKKSRDVKGAPECMRISGFVHGIINPKLIKRLHDKILKMMDEMMRVTASFLRWEVAASNHEEKSRSHHGDSKRDRFTLLTKTPKEIFALEKGWFKAPPPMTAPVKKQNHAKFCEFHGEVGHNTDECMHLKKQIEEMLKEGKLSYLMKELKQNNGKEQSKTTKKGETPEKEKPLAILMVQPWERIDTLDKFHGRKITVPIQWNYWKAWSQEVASSFINSSRNAKDPYRRRNNHLKSSMMVLLECAMVFGLEGSLLVTKLMVEERIKVPADMIGIPRHIAWTYGRDVLRSGKRKEGKQLIEIKQYRKKLENL